MNTLEKIVAYKKEELIVRKMMVPVDELIRSKYMDRKCLSLRENLLKTEATGIIAEFKRKSPSRGYINQYADVEQVTGSYTRFGASGLSILTDNHFFGGSTEDLVMARKNEIPILRKEFIIDSYQVLASKAMGADAILLIAACLSIDEVNYLASSAKSLGMEVLLEIHNENELGHIVDIIDLVGINNRDLRTFEVDTNRSLQLSKHIPPGKVMIAESGINDTETIQLFRQAGYKGFLIGEAFMKENNPGEAFNSFMKRLN